MLTDAECEAIAKKFIAALDADDDLPNEGLGGGNAFYQRDIHRGSSSRPGYVLMHDSQPEQPLGTICETDGTWKFYKAHEIAR